MSLEPVPDLTPSKKRDLVDDLLRGDEITSIPDPEPLITGVFDLNSTAVIYGPSGAMKSFVVLDWGLCIGTTTPWHGHEVVEGPVLYVLGEGLHGTRARYMAWKKHHEMDDAVDNIYWGPHAVDVQTDDGKEELLRAVEKVQPVLTILDTLARHLPGGDENAPHVMSHMVEALDAVKTTTGGCALAVHHTGKDESKGSRGHTSLKGSLDTEILCTKGPQLTVTKQKNHPDGIILGTFTPTLVDDSLILSMSNRRTNRNDELAIKALLGFDAPTAHNEWKNAAVSLGLPAGSFAAARKRLLESILVTDTTDTETGEVRYQVLMP